LQDPCEDSLQACRTLLEGFERQVRLGPSMPAVTYGATTLSYAELDERAARLAHAVANCTGLDRSLPVAILLDRSHDVIIAMLAILKAGACYLPLDTHSPRERTSIILDDAKPQIVITTTALASGVDCGMLAICLDRFDWTGPSLSSTWPDADVRAYVIFTSGSTGRPKGVEVTHRNVLRLFTCTERMFAFGPGDRWTLFHSCAFDFSVWEMWGALLYGGCLIVVSYDVTRDPQAFYNLVRQERITILNQTPSAFAQFSQADALSADRLSYLRTIIFGGEALAFGTLRTWLDKYDDQRPSLVNMYGITETTVHATHWRISRSDLESNQLLIGRPLDDLTIEIVDAELRRVAVGGIGELCIGGPGVTLGYLNRSDLTAERFIASPFAPGDRLYRSGDLGRLRADGIIEFVGRNDQQVKVRGFRVELGEIEAILTAHASVAQSVVIARENDDGEEQLVGYVTPASGMNIRNDDLRAFVADRLPDYMVPTAFVRLDVFVLTSSGKVDRRSLPPPDATAYATHVYEAPTGAIESTLASIWSTVLGVARVGRSDNFFSLGGHSLLAVRMAARVRSAFGRELSVRDVFLHPVLAELGVALVSAHVLDKGSTIIPIARSASMPMSFAQQRLWFLCQIEGANAAYNIPFGMRLHGELDVPALRGALRRLIEQHEPLRTTFGLEAGEPIARIEAAEHAQFRLLEHDVRMAADGPSEVRRFKDVEARTVFDLANGPLIRGRLIREGDSAWTFLITMHHIVSDYWSMGIFARDLSASYNARIAGHDDPLKLPAVQYADYAVWQRQWMQGERLEQQIYFWREALAEAPALLELPTDRPRPAAQDFAGSFSRLTLDEGLTARIMSLGRRHDSTAFMTILAAFGMVLARLSGSSDVVIGTPVANRGQTETESLIGFFVNTLALRLRIDDDTKVCDVLAHTRASVISAQEHQDVPFEQVVEALHPVRSLAHGPLFTVCLAWQNALDTKMSITGLDVDYADAAEHTVSRFDLTLVLEETGNTIAGGFEYATALFDATTIERFGTYLQNVLSTIVDDDRCLVGDIDMLAAEERDRILSDSNGTERAIPNESVAALFQRRAMLAPNAIAVIERDRSISYGALSTRAAEIAAELRMRDVRVGDRIVVAIERCRDLIAVELAILACGGIYVPLDAASPTSRLRYIIDDAGASLILTKGAGSTDMSLFNIEVVDVDTILEDESDQLLEPDLLSGETPAYVMYTSGSTGQPKGVVVAHRGIVRLVFDDRADFSASDRFGFASSPAFDLSTFEMWTPLLLGGTVVIVDQETLLDPSRFGDCLARNDVSVLWLTVGIFNQYAEVLRAQFAQLRYLVTGGDALTAKVIARMLHLGRPQHLCNGYGPTEATTFATWHEIEHVADDALSVPIGRPIGNTRVYVLDPQLRLVPTGAIGELCIGGPGVALGYLNRPELTAKRFIASPFVPGDRLYRSGDLGRLRADGIIEFVGRNDDQVKIRGFRVELGEIEAVLFGHASVSQAAVIARSEGGEKQLIAYVTSAPGISVRSDELRTFVASRLPDYMLPIAFVQLDAFALTSSGKIDRRSLPAPDAKSYATHTFEAPSGKIESTLASIWSALLGVERIGRRDSFFALGGHSLLAVRMISDAGEALDMQWTIRDIFEHPALADFAASCRNVSRDARSSDIRDEIKLSYGIYAASKYQRRPLRNVLLTGSTGFLGTFLLAALLERSEAVVHCLLRCSSEADGRRRLELALRGLDLYDRVDFSRIAIVPGDLGGTRLGLSGSIYDDLSERLDAIYHNGAWVHAFHDYHVLRQVNVGGTQELIRLAASVHPKPFHYVSTMDVFPKRLPAGARADDEDRLLANGDVLETGYAQTKWVAERVLQLAAGRGIPSAIYRPTHIFGATTGASNLADSWSRCIEACIALRAVPDFDADVDLLPVDYVSRIIVDLSLRDESLGRSFNLCNPTPARLHDLVDYLCLAEGNALERISFEEWLARCDLNGTTLGLRSLLTGGQPPSERVPIDRRPISALAREPDLVEPPTIDVEFLARCVRWIRNRRFCAAESM
jgi:amino acid adenylation domain-containing protein/thioester reductase-like protein